MARIGRLDLDESLPHWYDLTPWSRISASDGPADSDCSALGENWPHQHHVTPRSRISASDSPGGSDVRPTLLRPIRAAFCATPSFRTPGPLLRPLPDPRSASPELGPETCPRVMPCRRWPWHRSRAGPANTRYALSWRECADLATCPPPRPATPLLEGDGHGVEHHELAGAHIGLVPGMRRPLVRGGAELQEREALALCDG